MRIVFLQQLWYEWQAPMIFSAIAKQKGHNTVMYIKPNPRVAAKTAINNNADLIVFASITSGNIKYVYECAEYIKEQANIPIIAGGTFVSLYYRDISMKYIDFLGIGEGELTFSLILDFLENKASVKSIPGLAYVQNSKMIINTPKAISDINKIPTIDRELYYKYALFRKENVRMFYSGRGCLYNCSYCCMPLLDKIDPSIPVIRKRQPENLIGEISYVKKQYGLKAAFFQDDTFTQDKEWLMRFLPLYKKHIGKPFMCISRASDIDEDIANAFAYSGCIGVSMSLETANENIRKTILNRIETNSQIINTIKLLKERNIKVTTLNMVGIPGETLDDIYNTINFNRENKVDSAWAILFQPYVNAASFNIKKVREDDIGNFYSELGYECQDRKQIELIQKLFPLLINHPKLQNIIIKVIPRLFSGLIFSIYSFYREIRLWKRSFFITLIIGLKNQIQYKKNKK